VRIRPVWIAVPACAAAGVVTYSVVAAQEPAGPVGYYQSRVNPPATDAGPQYLRPLNDPQQPYPAGGQAPTSWTAPGSTTPARLAGTPTSPGALPPPRLTHPVAAGPGGDAIQPVGAMMPADPPKGRYFPDAAPPTLPPPDLSPSVVPAAPTPPAAPALPPPSVTFESSGPGAPPKADAPKPAEPRPLAVTGATPVTPAAVPSPLTTVPVMTVSPDPVSPATAGFPAAPLAARQAPAVVVEAVAPESIGVGQSLTYELVVRNTGIGAVANVKVEDEVPVGVKFLGSEPATEPSGNRLAWAVGVLEPGAEKRIKVTVKPADEGEFRSRAVATFSAAADARVRVTRPRVSVALAAADAVRAGDEVPIQIKVSNTGSGPAKKLVIQAKLSDGLHHPSGAVIEAELTNLPPGETKVVTLRALATKAGPQTCSIAAAADGNPTETAKAALSVVEPLLQMKLAGPARCLVRSEPTYTLELANPGTAATDPVQAWAVVPEGFEFQSASDGGAFNPANRTVLWKLSALPAGTTKLVSFKLRAAAPVEGVMKTVAQAVPPAQEAIAPAGVQPAGYRPAAGRVLEAKADSPVKAEGVPALRFEVADVEDPVEVGKEAVYEIKVVNQGTGPCTNVQVIATLADGTQVTGASGPTTGRGQGQQVVFEPIPTFDTKKEVLYQVRVRGTQPGDLRFRVQVTCDQIKSPIVKEENTRFFKE
jgi:uncharacterized repeat protein (TIGR01451 family)